MCIRDRSYSKIEDYVEAVCTKLRPLIESFGGVEKIKGMGVGAPNGNYYNGTIEFAPNLPWRGVIPLAALFEEKIGVQMCIRDRYGHSPILLSWPETVTIIRFCFGWEKIGKWKNWIHASRRTSLEKPEN